jgi:aspartyl-tRNA(Asn)/glutamyl-tRNA(Gln) amidotransferase subunit B
MTARAAAGSLADRYVPVIGLEIHAQLQTASKMFCGCSAAFGAPPNTHVCPVCLGLPGALPVVNHAAVEAGIRAALALGCRVNETSIFARKNYFYPDLPKGYQISQYEQPLAMGGALEIVTGGVRRRVGVTRVHLEEDAGKSLHEGFPDSDRRTYLDFNRSGTPLLEIVTEPHLESAAEAAEFFSRLRAILVWLEVNDGNMEEGSLRCDANVSVRRRSDTALGTKAEVKNLNSFRFLQRALEYEIERQIDVLAEGGRVVQETRLWDAVSNLTVSMRSKEEAHDYRYFPEPDLKPLVVPTTRVAAVRDSMPELPEARRARFVAAYGLPEYDAQQLTQTRDAADYFERAVGAGAAPKAISNWMRGELARLLKAAGAEVGDAPVEAEGLAGLLKLVDGGTLSGAMAKGVLEKMFTTGRTAAEIVAADGLAQIGEDGPLLTMVSDVLAAHSDAVGQYRAGKIAALGFLVGQVMKRAGGKANPKRVNELLRASLDDNR